MNNLFRECLASIPEDTRAELEMSFAIANRIADILKQKGLTQRDLAAMLGKRESEVSKWLTGRHNQYEVEPSVGYIADDGVNWHCQ